VGEGGRGEEEGEGGARRARGEEGEGVGEGEEALRDTDEESDMQDDDYYQARTVPHTRIHMSALVWRTRCTQIACMCAPQLLRSPACVA
jgi:hypothetical protein